MSFSKDLAHTSKQSWILRNTTWNLVWLVVFLHWLNMKSNCRWRRWRPSSVLHKDTLYGVHLMASRLWGEMCWSNDTENTQDKVVNLCPNSATRTWRERISIPLQPTWYCIAFNRCTSAHLFTLALDYLQPKPLWSQTKEGRVRSDRAITENIQSIQPLFADQQLSFKWEEPFGKQRAYEHNYIRFKLMYFSKR